MSVSIPPPTLHFPEVPFPLMARIRQRFPASSLKDVRTATRQELELLFLSSDFHRKRVAVGVGSRGIAHLPVLVDEVITYVKRRNGVPFIVPAMGSHGGGTAAGQRAVLASCGITEESIGAPIIAGEESVRIGTNAAGVPVYCDAAAWQADWLIPINRVKPHTQFHAPTESGLLKMLVIGFGKAKGAATIHGHGTRGLAEYIPLSAEVFLQSGKVLFGLAVVENQRHETALVRALMPEDFFPEEKRLLCTARQLMPRLPVESLDLLILDRMGKDISGPGMDSSVTGRIMANGEPDPPFPRISLLAVLGLTEASHGNAVGVGLADLISHRLCQAIDVQATYLNSISGGFPVQGKIPMVMPDDRQLLQAAAVLLGAESLADRRIIHARDTLHLEELEVSTAVLQELEGRTDLEVLRPLAPMAFDSNNLLLPVEYL